MPPENKSILVTGAGGYIGRHAVKALLERGCRVTALSRGVGAVDARAERIDVNIFSLNGLPPDVVRRITGGADACLHLAWQDGFTHNAESHITQLGAHFRFLQTIADAGIRHIAVMGSMHEIGRFTGMAREDTPCGPLSYYGIAKDALRRSLTVFAENNHCVLQWLRAFYVTGDDKQNHSVFTKIMEAEARGEETFPFTSGTNRYDFIDVAELARQIACAVTQRAITGVINCCSGEASALKDKAEEFLRVNNFKIKLRYGAFPERPYDSPELYGDNAKIKAILEAAS